MLWLPSQEYQPKHYSNFNISKTFISISASFQTTVCPFHSSTYCKKNKYVENQKKIKKSVTICSGQPQKMFVSGSWSSELCFQSEVADTLTIFFCLTHYSLALNMISQVIIRSIIGRFGFILFAVNDLVNFNNSKLVKIRVTSLKNTCKMSQF